MIEAYTLLGESYKAYSLSDVKAAAQRLLGDVQQAQRNEVEESIRSNQAVYHAYPFKDARGFPRWQSFTQKEKDGLHTVKCPGFIQLLFPSLKDQVIVRGADLQKPINPITNPIRAIKKGLQKLAWHVLPRDDSEYWAAHTARGVALDAAENAYWQISVAKMPTSDRTIENGTIEIGRQLIAKIENVEIGQQESQRNETPYLWLTGAQFQKIQNALTERDLRKFDVLAGAALSQTTYIEGNRVREKASQDLLRFSGGMEEIAKSVMAARPSTPAGFTVVMGEVLGRMLHNRASFRPLPLVPVAVLKFNR